jgi:hypothetical protein
MFSWNILWFFKTQKYNLQIFQKLGALVLSAWNPLFKLHFKWWTSWVKWTQNFKSRHLYLRTMISRYIKPWTWFLAENSKLLLSLTTLAHMSYSSSSWVRQGRSPVSAGSHQLQCRCPIVEKEAHREGCVGEAEELRKQEYMGARIRRFLTKVWMKARPRGGLIPHVRAVASACELWRNRGISNSGPTSSRRRQGGQCPNFGRQRPLTIPIPIYLVCPAFFRNVLGSSMQSGLSNWFDPTVLI